MDRRAFLSLSAGVLALPRLAPRVQNLATKLEELLAVVRA